MLTFGIRASFFDVLCTMVGSDRGGDGRADGGEGGQHQSRAPSVARPVPAREPSRGHSRTRRSGNGIEIVIHKRVVQGGGAGTIVYTMLTITNYIDWSLIMRINLRAQGLWEAMSGMGVPGDRDDMAAMSALLRAVPPEMIPVLAIKETAQEAWEAVRMMRMGVSRIREATAQIAFKEGETLDAFGLWITALVNNVRSLGDIIDKVKVVQKILREVPS